MSPFFPALEDSDAEPSAPGRGDGPPFGGGGSGGSGDGPPFGGAALETTWSASARVASEPSLGRALKLSAITHLIFLVLILIKSLIFPSQPIVYIPSLRVDLVGLPDVLKKDRANLSKTPAPEDLNQPLKEAETPAKSEKTPTASTQADSDPAAMALKNKKTKGTEDRNKRLRRALERIKSLQKLEGADDDVPARPTVIKGNRISRGTSLSGDARESAEASYFDSMRDRLQQNWALPVWLARQNHSAQAQIQVDSRGRLRSLKLIKSSGNAQFDEAVKRTIISSQPFPAPPAELEESLLIDGILVGFPL